MSIEQNKLSTIANSREKQNIQSKNDLDFIFQNLEIYEKFQRIYPINP
jgi:hypothetical protein